MGAGVRESPVKGGVCSRTHHHESSYHSPVSDEDLEAAHELGQRDRLVGLPLLGLLDIVDEDHEVLVLSLVVALVLACFSTNHDCGFGKLDWVGL